MPFYERPNRLQLDCDDYYIDRRSVYISYTDGACFGNNNAEGPRFSGYGINYGPGREISQHCHTDDLDYNTNNYAELKAVLIAIRHADRCNLEKVQIRSDSEWTINCLRGDYNANCHSELFNEIYNICDDLEVVEWCHVERSSERGNRIADDLAKAGAAKHEEIYYNN